VVIKCNWCNKRCETPLSKTITFRGDASRAEFSSTEHFEETQRFMKYAEKHLMHFLLGLILSSIVGINIVILNYEQLGLFITFVGIGLIIIIFPFATPETNRLLGLKRAIFLVRSIDIIIIGMGIASWFLMG